MFHRRNNWAYTILVFCLMACLAFTAHAQTGKPAQSPAPVKPGQPEAVKSGNPSPAKPGQPDTLRSSPAPAAKPAATQKAGAAKQDAAPKFNIEDFTYNPSGTRNPFEPILLLKAKTSRGLSVKSLVSTKKMPEKGKPDKIDYELEELRLVGVIKSGNGMIAMMEDTQGKGVFFRRGDYLNKSMWVEDVTASNMVLGYKARGETKKITVDIPSKR